MIACEKCQEKYHPDDLKFCPNTSCTYEFLCPICYEEHVSEC